MGVQDSSIYANDIIEYLEDGNSNSHDKKELLLPYLISNMRTAKHAHR